MRRFFIALVLAATAGCSTKADYSAETRVEEVVINVRLSLAHPILAEYTRELEVEIGGRTVRQPLIMDSGGYAWVAVANDHGTIEVKTIGDLIRFPKALKDPAKRVYLGRFDFDSEVVPRSYRFIPASSDQMEPQLPSTH